MKRVVFCGVGAIGSNAVVAVRNLGAALAFVDFDRVESKNCLTQSFVKASIGRNKAEALKLQLHNFWGVRAEAFAVRLQESNVATLCAGADLLVDAFDNAASRRVLSAHARAAQVPLLHAGLAGDGTFGLVRWEERFAPDEEGADGRTATCEAGEHLPVITLLAAALARAIEDFMKSGARNDAVVSLNGVQT